MTSGNINLRDPAIYRIRKVTHQNTGDQWPIYPMYDYAHCLSDALEGITHSLCTLEFEDHRPLYDWFVDNVDLPSHPELWQHMRDKGFRTEPAKPRQIEFSRLNLSYMITSKRKLAQLVNDGLVDSWDDPRMNTLRGLRRRGFTPGGIRLLIERLGVSKQNSVIDYVIFENCVREDLDASAQRRMAVIDPLKLVITNLPEGHEETLTFSNHPKDESAGTRLVSFARELWIEREDFAEVPPKGFHRLKPEGEVRLRGVGIVKCEQMVKDAAGNITELHCTLDPESRSGMPGADRKVKGTIHWVSARHGVATEIRLYDRLFNVPTPDDETDGKTWIEHINPEAKRIVRGWLEPSAAQAAPEQRYQFERLGYFVADRIDHRADAPVFNRTVTLRDNWAKQA
jgi:glutaminyl-tRNA synthetase